MLHTTFAKLKEAGACRGSYRKGVKLAGGITKYGKDTPIPLSLVLEHFGLDDTLWCLSCTIEPAEGILIEFACRCAEHVLHLFEKEYPNDKRPQRAIEAARRCITDKSRDAGAAARAAAWAAWAAARAAARDAAGAAARAAAWAAAWAAGAAARAAARDAAGAAAWAETEWQKKTFLELLKKGGDYANGRR